MFTRIYRYVLSVGVVVLPAAGPTTFAVADGHLVSVLANIEAKVLHTYEAKIRLDGRVSTTQVKASDAGHAKKLVQQQFPGATILSVKKVD